MDKYTRTYELFEKAFRKFEEVIINKSFLNIITQEMLIELTTKRFEYTFESMWKTAKEYLRLKGIICNSPKSCFNELIKEGTIAEEYEEILSQMIKIRNFLVHVYDERTAQYLYETLNEPAITETFKVLLHSLKV